MIELTAEGTIEEEITELTRMVLTEIIVKDKNNLTVVFMDGTKKNVSLQEIKIEKNGFTIAVRPLIFLCNANEQSD